MYRIFVRVKDKYYDVINKGKDQKISLVDETYKMEPDDRYILFETRKDAEIFSKMFDNYDGIKIIYEGEPIDASST